MPEITTAEAILKRLQDLDKKLESAIESADALTKIRQKSDEQLSALIKAVKQADADWRKINDTRNSAEGLHDELTKLHKERRNLDVEAQASRETLLQQFTAASRTIDNKWVEVENRLQLNLQTANEETLSSMKSLSDTVSDMVQEAKSISIKIKATASELRENFEAKFFQLQSQVEAAVENWTLHSTERFDEFHAEVLGKYKDIQAGVSTDLGKHFAQVDNSITSFLTKQNALIQNLTQHTESFERVTKSNADKVEALEQKLDESELRFLGLKSQCDKLEEQLQSMYEKMGKKSMWPFGKS